MIKHHHRFALALAAVYLVGLALILLWPTPVDKPVAGTLNEVITWAHRQGMPKTIGYHQVEFTANVVLFVPMGYLATIWSRNAWVGIVIGALISCFMELSQTLLLPHRVGSGLDVLANTLGAAVGAAICWRLGLSKPVVEPVSNHNEPETRTVT